MPPSLPPYHPEAFARRRPYLLVRSRVLAALRAFFAARGALEVDTPALQVSPGLEPHLMAFKTRLDGPFGQGKRDLYLHTSPEFAMKKILAAGEPAIFQIAHVFRNGERSPTHHPEFTMLEWYRVGQSFSALMDETEALVAAVARAAGTDVLHWKGQTFDPFGPWERLSVSEALARHTGINLPPLLDHAVTLSGQPHEPDPGPLAAAAQTIGVRTEPQDRFEDVFFRILLDRVEPHLGHERPCFLYGYPLCMAALSRPDPADPRFAERFEAYVGGLELANAFGELTDPVEQRARFVADMDVKERLYGERYPLDEAFLEALHQGLPPCCGSALGVDRLVMLVSGARHIDDVQWMPVVS
ncbi:EF-P lysine aminoacylase EpmA [Pararhodospirillum photometricum]|uniref:tRNA synthetase, class II (D, K and N) n=1 Tax=Pararhodospirillum photometricum DSM 122 TaxID=1150469 RepID=H6SIK6_PARPM|nr:EF-P lysine aminoacylase EpmA [Pararhodospirillum photometricum]CCG06633.1 tRNA synthetase, class II (D, K and N) [Pararhodospirillum photometricum DSM 122]